MPRSLSDHKLGREELQLRQPSLHPPHPLFGPPPPPPRPHPQFKLSTTTPWPRSWSELGLGTTEGADMQPVAAALGEPIAHRQ